MDRRAGMCPGCPFNSRRTGPAVPADVWAAVMARIRGGERWVCHQTCDGPRITPSSQLCAGAPAVMPASRVPAPAGSDPRVPDETVSAAERQARDEARSDMLADEIAAGIVAACASRADLDAAERVITRTAYL